MLEQFESLHCKKYPSLIVSEYTHCLCKTNLSGKRFGVEKEGCPHIELEILLDFSTLSRLSNIIHMAGKAIQSALRSLVQPPYM